MPFLILIPILAVLIFLYIRKTKKTSTQRQNYDQLIPSGSTYEFLKYQEIQDTELVKSNASSVYLVHGTFVGDDPFDLISLLERAFPSLKSTIIQKIKDQTKSGQDFLIKDFGNFHSSVSKSLRKYFTKDIKIDFFTWSSSNHHIARVRSAIDLLCDISNRHKVGEEILLYGHSHAGQLFSIISQLINDKLLREQILSVLKLDTSKTKEMLLAVRKVQKIKLVFITLGTPVRYSWSLSSNTKLVHFINHRGAIPQGGGLSSSLMTKSGDYIQQWAVAGSDMVSPIEAERKMNSELDLILGTGSNIELLRKNIKFKKRLHNHGHHFLVDFQDNSRIPNSLLTLFGHAIYTKKSQFNWIVQQSIKFLNR